MCRSLLQTGILRRRSTMPCNFIATDTFCTIAGGAVNMAPVQTFLTWTRAARNIPFMAHMAVSTCRRTMLVGYTGSCNYIRTSSSTKAPPQGTRKEHPYHTTDLPTPSVRAYMIDPYHCLAGRGISITVGPGL